MPEVVDDRAKSRLATILPELPDYIESLMLKLNDDKGFCHKNLTKEQKSSFCRAYFETGNLEDAAHHIGISFPTAYLHIRRDPDFQDAVALTKLSTGLSIQGKSVQMARKDHGVTDRMCQMKRHFPNVYGSHVNQTQVNIIGLQLLPNSRITHASQ